MYRDVLIKYGLDPKDKEQWRLKYGSHVRNARGRGLVSELTFEQYVKLAVRAGISSPEQIGCASYADHYQLGRKGDTGDYTYRNCRFITMGRNQEEKELNGGKSRGYEKLSRLMLDKVRAGDVVTPDNRRRFKAVDPVGKIYRGTNLAAFCRAHQLSKSGLSKVCLGQRASHKGWTAVYLN